MAANRGASPKLTGNPFIKKRNLEWSLDVSNQTHNSDESSSSDESRHQEPRVEQEPSAPAVEAGKVQIEDHLNYFSGLLTKATLSDFPTGVPRISIDGYRRLYETNSGSPAGAHFVVHQHDHPIAGTHYDLRLQINETSSASWAIMYGLPGDPNSQRLNRNATETRIHCLWKLPQPQIGSLLIWDTGTYTILPPREIRNRADSNSQSEEEDMSRQLTEQEKLHNAFQTRKIHIRLNGTRLPHDYALNLRQTKEEDAAGRAKSALTPTRRRARGASSRGRATARGNGKAAEPATSSDSAQDDDGLEIDDAPADEAGEALPATERAIRELEFSIAGPEDHSREAQLKQRRSPPRRFTICSAYPPSHPPKSVEEESQMLSTLESQLQFVRAIREVDTTRVEPLCAIRDETTQGMHEQTIGLEQLKEALGKEDVVGHARRPRRRQREEDRARKDMGGEEKETVYPEAEGWDVLAGASETAGRYFVVRTGSSGPTQTEQASRNTEHLKKT
ncbi:DNA polymerase ligase-domain-containing protein [Jackrogersella minutella]|nr:DNA polymerase ligase-domain-containing protein [Jackrogersella minutella]